jgi:hypothetical protein
MDYPNRSRLKVLGRVRLVNDDEPELLARLEMDDYRAVVERGFLIHIEAFDWNCPQHITPRYSDGEVEATIAPLLQQIEDLEDAGGRQQTPRRLGSGPLPLIITGVRQLTPQIRAYESDAADSRIRVARSRRRRIAGGTGGCASAGTGNAR